MKKQNEYGDDYHVMNFPPSELKFIRDVLLDAYNSDRLNDYDYSILQAVDVIEKELEIK